MKIIDLFLLFLIFECVSYKIKYKFVIEISAKFVDIISKNTINIKFSEFQIARFTLKSAPNAMTNLYL